MRIQDKINAEINKQLNVAKVLLENESHMHAGNAPESHFKLILVSDDFAGLSKVKRHQKVYKILQQLMPSFHALALHTFTVLEWENNELNLDSPLCAGSAK
jgi:BolA protein